MTRTLLVCVALLVFAACGSHQTSTPTSPTSSAGPTLSAVVISGTAAFTAPGQTAQLTALARSTDGAYQDVSTAAAWSSTNSAIATVSNAGFVTAIALGSVTISANYQGKSATVPILIGEGASGTISACGTYTGVGAYVLATDLQQTSRTCLTLSSSVGGLLDCQGHDAKSLRLSNVRSFTIRNCSFHGTIADSSNRLQNLVIENSSDLVVDAADAVGQVTVMACVGCTFRRDTFVYPKIGFTVSSGFVSCELCFTNGVDNQVLDSTIDAGYDGNFATYQHQGCDDAILLNREVNLTIRRNVIRSAFDAGIEPGTSNGPIMITVADNQISDIGYTGIGSYYVEGFQNSVFSGNIVSNTPNLLRIVASAATGVTAGTLLNNQFVNNTLVNPIPLPPIYGGSVPASAIINMVGRASTNVSGNLIQGNTFGQASAGPTLAPAQGFIDGGGNTCLSSVVIRCGG